MLFMSGMLIGALWAKRKLRESKDDPTIKKGVTRAIFLFTATALVLVTYYAIDEILYFLFYDWRV